MLEPDAFLIIQRRWRLESWPKLLVSGQKEKEQRIRQSCKATIRFVA
jgi:hypothetical protein